MASTKKRVAEEVSEDVKKVKPEFAWDLLPEKVRQNILGIDRSTKKRPNVFKDPVDLTMYDDKINALRNGVDSYWFWLPDEMQERILDCRARVKHKELFSVVLRDLMSFGACSCSNNINCKEHHARSVLINWRYKVSFGNFNNIY